MQTVTTYVKDNQPESEMWHIAATALTAVCGRKSNGVQWDHFSTELPRQVCAECAMASAAENFA